MSAENNPRRITMKQEAFVDALIETKNGTEAAVRAYNVSNRETASAIATENLRKPSVQLLLQDRIAGVVDNMHRIATKSKNEWHQFKASQDLLDRHFGKAGEHVTMNQNVKMVSFDI